LVLMILFTVLLFMMSKQLNLSQSCYANWLFCWLLYYFLGVQIKRNFSSFTVTLFFDKSLNKCSFLLISFLIQVYEIRYSFSIKQFFWTGRLLQFRCSYGWCNWFLWPLYEFSGSYFLSKSANNSFNIKKIIRNTS